MKRMLVVLLGGLFLLPLAAKDIDTDEITYEEGTLVGRMGRIPWAGQWWSQSGGKMIKGWNGASPSVSWDAAAKKWVREDVADMNLASPLRKASEIILRQTGQDPEADLREDHVLSPIQKHRYDSLGISYGWWGHCNGWAAAALTEKEVMAPVTVEGVRLDVADFKAMLSEVCYGMDSDFSGSRYNDPRGKTALRDRAEALLASLATATPSPKEDFKQWYEDLYNDWYDRDDYKYTNTSYTAETFKGTMEWFVGYYKEKFIDAKADIHAHVFDAILVTLLVNQGRGAVMDMDSGPEVWNFPFHACEIVRTLKEDLADGGKRFSMQTKLYYQSDGVDESILGVREHVNNYTYEIDVDADGKMLESRWTGDSVEDHPDFIWLPTYNSDQPTGDENPGLPYGTVKQWMAEDHSSADARIATLKINGVKSDDHRAGRQARTIASPLSASGELQFSVDLLTGHGIDKVSYYRQNIAHLNGESWKSVQGDLEHVGDGSGSDFALAYSPATSGRKMFVVKAFKGETLVSMDELTVSYTPGTTTPPTPTGDDSFEENDSRSEASLVGTGSYPDLECNDNDYYKIEVPANGSLTVKIEFKHSEGDLDMRLYSPSNSKIAGSESTSNEETVSKTGLSAGNYYVRVFGYNGAKASYDLTVTVSGGATTPPPTSTDDNFEENDSRSEAHAISVGTYSDLRCDDDDWFSYTATAGQALRLRIEFAHSDGDLDLYLVDAQGNEITKSWSASDNEEISHTPSASGVLYFRIEGYQGAQAPYRLIVE